MSGRAQSQRQRPRSLPATGPLRAPYPRVSALGLPNYTFAKNVGVAVGAWPSAGPGANLSMASRSPWHARVVDEPMRGIHWSSSACFVPSD